MRNDFVARTLVSTLLSIALVSAARADAPPFGYAISLVATAADGVDMNDAGTVIGTSRLDTGCGSTCLPLLDTVVWKSGKRIVLPTVSGLTGITVTGINAHGWVTGFAGVLFTTTHAVVWKPVGSTYQAIDLGTLPGTTISSAVGIDDLGRVVGWSTTSNFPPTGSPFMWTEVGGMVDLSAQGFPDEQPLALSPGGNVATAGSWYRLGDPGSVQAMPPTPSGFTLGSDPTAINNAGDQARFLISTSTGRLRYLFRFNHEGTWQQISFLGNGSVAYGVGSINEAGDITATIVGDGQIAYGPDGFAESLAPLVSAAYGGGVLTVVGPINASGQILAKMIIGQTGQRLVKLTPGKACTNNCTRITGVQMTGKGPEFCNQGNDQVKAQLSVRDEAGVPLSSVRITGHFLDDYWLDQVVTGQTNASGQVVFRHVGPACVGAVAFLVTDAAKSGRAFDRTTGTLTNYVIP